MGAAEKIQAWIGLLICSLLFLSLEIIPNAFGRWLHGLPYVENTLCLALLGWFCSGYFIPSQRPSMPTFDGIKQRWVQVAIVVMVIVAVTVDWLARHGYFGAPP